MRWRSARRRARRPPGSSTTAARSSRAPAWWRCSGGLRSKRKWPGGSATSTRRWRQYDTPSQGIGRGSLAGVYTISPSHKGKSLGDAQIGKELVAQIRKGALPAADANTVYLIHFPPGVSIDLGGSGSCQAGGFCGYHNTLRSGRTHLRYAVIPDMSAGSGCDTGCGGSTPFAAVTSVASHELVEAITDPDVGLARRLAAPLGWYDASNGEIGDICAGHEGTVHAGGSVWTVQKQWSNKAQACVLR
jgi:hypothetical protein